MQEIIARGLDTLGLRGRVPDEAPAQLAAYGALMLEKNEEMNLSAIRDEAGVARFHMLDCAALLTQAEFAGASLVDVGTGAGFPGLALKILVPELEVTLLDSLAKRLDWLEEVIAALGLTGVRTVHTRAEEAAHDPALRGRFDFATARALAQLRTLGELCLPYVKPGGLFLAMKALDCDAECADAAHCLDVMGAQLETVHAYTIPDTQVTRRLLMIRKTADTPPDYPRRWKRMHTHPL